MRRCYENESVSHAVMSNSATPRTVARQVPLPVGVLQARILEWVAIPPPGNLPNPGVEPRSPALQADSSLPQPAGESVLTPPKPSVLAVKVCDPQRLSCRCYWLFICEDMKTQGDYMITQRYKGLTRAQTTASPVTSWSATSGSPLWWDGCWHTQYANFIIFF